MSGLIRILSCYVHLCGFPVDLCVFTKGPYAPGPNARGRMPGAEYPGPNTRSPPRQAPKPAPNPDTESPEIFELKTYHNTTHQLNSFNRDQYPHFPASHLFRVLIFISWGPFAGAVSRSVTRFPSLLNSNNQPRSHHHHHPSSVPPLPFHEDHGFCLKPRLLLSPDHYLRVFIHHLYRSGWRY